MNLYDPPAMDEIEVSIFGPGYGEAIVIHLGRGQWVLVDSCLNPKNKQVASLEYLRALDIDVEQSVKLIVATHWHDDHVAGLSDILRQCKSACLVMSAALESHEFIKLTSLYEQHNMTISSGVDQFAEIFRIIEDRSRSNPLSTPLKWAGPDTWIYGETVSYPQKQVSVNIYTLSPSNIAIKKAYQTFAGMIGQEREPKKRVTEKKTNEFAVALWLEINDHNVLLGSDLQNTGMPDTGWSAILNNSVAIKKKKASAFKLPHHGAESGHSDSVWTDHLVCDPVAFCTPFNRGNVTLPSRNDLIRTVSLTPNSFLTAAPKISRYRFSDSLVRNKIKEVAIQMHTINQSWGQIRLRRKIFGKTGQWDVHLLGDAIKVTDVVNLIQSD